MSRVFDLQAQGTEFIPQHPHKESGMVAYSCNPRVEDPWGPLASQPDQIVKSQTSERHNL